MNHKLITSLAAACALTASASALTIGFDTDADYDNNFVELAASGTVDISTFTFASTERALRKTGTGTQSVIFDTAATGGSSGTGGTAGGDTNLFGDVSISVDIRISTFNTPSLGLWTRVNSDESSGYLGLINIISATSVQLRVFDSNANPAGNGVGTALVNQTLSTGATTLNTSTFYTATFTTTTISPSEVSFGLSLSMVGGPTIVSTSVSDTSLPVLSSGQVGFRAASSTLYVDNFTVPTPVPEPSSAALLLGAATWCCVLIRRRGQR